MARLRRIFAPGIPSHITVRGNDRQDIFRGEGDRLFFYACLLDASRRHGLAIHAYVLMTNHVHLVATAAHSGSAPKAVQAVGRRYVDYFNKRHARSGTLWEGRYRSCPVETDRYLLACHRYVDLNPVRVGLVRHPDEFPWSSHRAYAQGWADDLVTPHPVVLSLATDGADRYAAYRALFDEPLTRETLDLIRKASRAGRPLGSDAFRSLLEEEAGVRAGGKRGWVSGRSRGIVRSRPRDGSKAAMA